MTEPPAPYQPNPKLKRVESGLDSLIFNSRFSGYENFVS